MIAVGFGARAGVEAEQIVAAVDRVLAERGIRAADVRVLATVDRRALTPGLRESADDRGWRLVGSTAAQLATREVPNPSERVGRAVGTPSVAEAAALVAAGAGSVLVVPKQILPGVTVAVARSAG